MHIADRTQPTSAFESLTDRDRILAKNALEET